MAGVGGAVDCDEPSVVVDDPKGMLRYSRMMRRIFELFYRANLKIRSGRNGESCI